MASAIDKRLAEGGEAALAAYRARVKSLVEDVPDLPNFSRFHDACRDNPKGRTAAAHLLEAYYLAYDAAAREYVKINSKQIVERLKNGPDVVSAKFVFPYPSGFP